MITIEPISETHLDLVHLYASDKRISDTSNVPHPYTREMADDWFKMVCARQESGQSKVFAIIFDGYFAGVISLNNISPQDRKSEIDYWVAVKFQGKGIATSAVAKMLGIRQRDSWDKDFH
jgi:ribosomal-protein-alanine N-acetyltransferase